MEVSLTEVQQAQLDRIAQQQGVTVGDLLIDAASMIIQIEEHHWQAVERALAQADRGELIDEEEMDARIEAMLSRR